MLSQERSNRGELVVGGGLVLLGLIFLFSTLFHINVWAFCWPVLLIGVGVWLVARPRLGGPGTASEVQLLGDLRRRGAWAVTNQEFWLGVADVDLDLTQAVIPTGETVLRIYGFVGDVKVYAPRAVGVSVRVGGFVMDTELLGRDYDGLLTPIEVASEGYESAVSRVRIEMTCFVSNLKVRQF